MLINQRLFFLFRNFHLALSHIECDVKLRGFRCRRVTSSLSQVLENFQTLWLEFSEEKRMKQEEEDSMYKFKSKSHCVDSDEAEKNEKSFKLMFPSFDEDYKDLVAKNSLDDSDNGKPDSNDDPSSSINFSARDMDFVDVCRIFNSLKAITDENCQLSDTTLMQIFIGGYKEFCLLSSLKIIKNGELLFFTLFYFIALLLFELFMCLQFMHDITMS